MDVRGPFWQQWLVAYRRPIAFFLAAVAVVTLVGLRIVSSRQASGLHDFLHADHYYHLIQVEEGDNEEIIAELQGIISRHEELHSKYGGQLAQKAINHGKPKVAEGYTYSVQNRLQDEFPLASRFSNTSLLIAEGEYQEALQEAIALKLALEQEKREDLQTLHAYNLLRIAMLHEEVDNPPEMELAAWRELQKHLLTHGSSTKSSKAFQLLLRNFHKGNVGLNDYITERIKHLQAI